MSKADIILDKILSRLPPNVDIEREDCILFAKEIAELSYDAWFNYDFFLGGGGKEYPTKEQFINQLFNDTP